MYQLFFESIEDFFYTLSTVLMLIWISIYSWQQKKYIQLLIDLDGIVEKRNQNMDVCRIYQQTSVKLDDIMGVVHLIMMESLVPFVVIAYISILVYKQLFWGYTSNSFWDIFPTTLQVNVQTPVGFLVGTIVQVAAVFITTELFIVTLMVIIQLRFFEADFILDLKRSLKQLSEEIALGSGKLPTDQQGELKKKLVDLMQFYFEAKEFVKRFESVNGAFVFVYILYGYMSFCGLVIQMNNIFITGSIVGILQVLVPASITIFWLCFLSCFGFKKTQRIEEMGDDIHKLNIEYFQLC